MPKWLPDQVLAQVAAGLIAALGFWLKGHGDRRNKTKQYEGVLTRAKSEVDTLASWIRAYRLVAGADKVGQANMRAEYDLDALYSRIINARTDFEQASAKTAKEVSPHYGLAAVALIAFFFPTGLVAIIYSIQTRQALRSGDLDLARRRSRRVVLWFWISAGVAVVWYVVILSSPTSGS